MKIEIIENGIAPQRMTDGAVGYDCFAREVELHRWEGDQFILTGATIKLGFKIDCSTPEKTILDINFGAFLFPRSGWARKYGFRLKNTIGVIDPDYRGEVIAEVEFYECPPELLDYFNKCIEFEKDGSFDEGYSPNQPRVCQMVFLPCYVGELTQVEGLGETKRGEGGFGSTNQ